MVRFKDLRALITVFFVLISVMPAEGWNPHLAGDFFAPETFLVVNKKNQNMALFSNKSPLREEHSWECTTGQNHGDKMVEGDLRTPEGIYFLERRIAGSHLPYELYGELAFTLNYPNPVDRINRKTGHSIWIHGRGKDVVPYDTEGCVAMDMDNMLVLESHVRLGITPVLITENASWEPAETASENSRRIVERSLQWAQDWHTKSDRYFDYYDQHLYPKSSGQGFRQFRSHKQGLFDRYLWMDVYIDYPKVLKGPEYWVSYFGQVFKAPGFYSVGVKRLYWKQDSSGEFMIIGEEWRSYPDNYLEEKYLASRKNDLQNVVRRWQEAWLSADPEKYGAFYHQDAVQNDLRGIKSIVDHKKDIWGRGLLPATLEIENIRILPIDQGFKVEFHQSYSSVTGYSDFGHKALIMAPFGNDWLIKSEIWSEIS